MPEQDPNVRNKNDFFIVEIYRKLMYKDILPIKNIP